ncbi:MAG: bacillithiol biosynthesis cysteine-adding enzyme BshC [candidate division Zixibacteria bacterium]|nr:bacillithiol biosynthesis cysteine-adding enzyme BshC [candidate division Zixibacteria bacterium]
MIERAIPFSKQAGYSTLFHDFVDSGSNLSSFFPGNTAKRAIDEVISREYQRQLMVDILTRQNRDWCAPQPVLDNIEKLKQDNSIIVTAGQQAVLFGGQYMILLKAIGAIKKAEEIERQFNIPAVPLFWIAADDHDFQEISFVHMPNRRGELEKLAVDVPKDNIQPPVGAISFDTSMEREIEGLTESLPDNDFKQEALDLLTQHYSAGKGIVESFGSLMTEFLGKYGLVMFNPYDHKFKKACAPVLSEIISQTAEIKNSLANRNNELKDAGYHLQVEKAKTAAYMFYHSPHRTPLHTTESGYSAGADDFSRDEVLHKIEADALQFSPDVITRPLMQSYFFPVASFIGGPAEIAYFAQLRPLFDLFAIPAPEVCMRPSATLIEKKHEKTISEYQLSFSDITSDISRVIDRIVMSNFPSQIESKFNNGRNRAMRELREFKESLTSLNKGLDDAINGVEKKIDYQYSEIWKKVISAHKKKNKLVREKLSRLHENLYPYNTPAERVISPIYFVSRYGRGIIDFIFEQVSSNVNAHQILTLSEYHEKT